MQPAPDSTRGIGDRGTRRSKAERNLPRGSVQAVIPERNYNIAGFDIGSADLNKPGIKEQLEPIVEQLHTRMGNAGRHPVVRITGHASESRVPGQGHDVYAANRANAVRDYLVSRGIPAAWIETAISRTNEAGSTVRAQASPNEKAAARAATVEIGMSERRPGVAERFGDPQYVVGKPRYWPTWPKFPKVVKYAPDLAPLRRLLGIGLAGAGVIVAAGGVVVHGVSVAFEEVLEIAKHSYGKDLGPASREYLAKKLEEAFERHHVFVQELINEFREAGIDPHAYTAALRRSLHRWIHETGWNEVSRTFFEIALTLGDGKMPSGEEIGNFVALMMEEWNIDPDTLERYRQKRKTKRR